MSSLEKSDLHWQRLFGFAYLSWKKAREISNCWNIKTINERSDGLRWGFPIREFNHRIYSRLGTTIKQSFSPEDRDAILAWLRCEEAAIFVVRIMSDLLQDEIEKADIAWLRVIVHPRVHYRVYELQNAMPNCSHTIILVTLRAGLELVIDLTGNQYAYTEYIMSYNQYSHDHIVRESCRWAPEKGIDKVEMDDESEQILNGVTEIFKTWRKEVKTKAISLENLAQMAQEAYDDLLADLLRRTEEGISSLVTELNNA